MTIWKKFITKGNYARETRIGQAMIEILIAMALLTMAISAAITLIFGGQSLTIAGGEAVRALRHARNDLEEARSEAMINFPGLSSASSTASDGIFVDRVVEDVDGHTKKVTVRATWNTNPLKTEQVELLAFLTDWREVRDRGGDTGGGGISGDWRNPQTLGSIDLGPGNEATGLDVVGKIIYLSARASDIKKDDFFIVDATSGSAPVILSSTSTGPGLLGIDVANSYAYVVNDDTEDQLQIIDVSDMGSPRVEASFDLPGVSGPGSEGKSIFYSAGKVYVGTGATSGPEFHIVDVSDPSLPVSLGTFEVSGDVNDIYVSGNLAYIAVSNDNKELRILDVGDPTSITEVGFVDIAGSEDGKTVFLSASRLYFGRNTATGDEFLIYNVEDADSPELLGSAEIGADVNGIRVREELAFIGTSHANQEFQVWNISDPENIDFWSSFNFPQVASDIDYEDNLIYVSVRSNDAVRIITSGP